MSAKELIERIRRDPKIPAPSHAVFQVLELTRDPDCEVKAVARIISRDGGLTAQLLRQANSALYGFSTTTSSVADACTRLGLKRVRSAVINQHVVNGLASARPPNFDSHRYWKGALATSVAAKDLAQRFLPGAAEDAGTAGLLCDIGIGLLAFGSPDAYRRVFERVPQTFSREFTHAETALLGVTHAEIGAAVLSDWGIEQSIIDAVRLHHHDPLAPAEAELARFSRMVAAATTLSAIALDGSDMDSVAMLFAHIESVAPEPDEVVSQLLETLVQHIQTTADSLAVEIGSVDHMRSNFEQLVNDLPDTAQAMSFRPMSRESFQ